MVQEFLEFSFPKGGSSGNPEWEMAPAKLSIVRLSEKIKAGQAPSAPGSKTTHGPGGRGQWTARLDPGQYLLGSEAVEAREGIHIHPCKVSF